MVNLYNGIKANDLPLTINIIDFFSLNDLIQIEKNLIRYKEYEEYFNNNEKLSLKKHDI